MISPARFDRIHAKGAFARLCSMLADPAFAYERIGGKFGLTRQRIAHIATTTKRKTNAMTYSRYSLMWSIHHDLDLYARRDPEGKDGAREHASAGVTAGSSASPRSQMIRRSAFNLLHPANSIDPSCRSCSKRVHRTHSGLHNVNVRNGLMENSVQSTVN